MSQKNEQCVIHWVHEKKHDVWPVTSVPAELRFEGAVGLIKYSNGKQYVGRIVKKSGEYYCLRGSLGFQIFPIATHLSLS